MKKILLVAAAVVLVALVVHNKASGEKYPVLQESRSTEAVPELKQKILPTTLKVTKLNLKSAKIVILNDEVNSETANAVIEGIQKANATNSSQPIYLLLDSPGGSVLDGARIISAMQASKAPVYTVCLQICASMAAMILEYGVERYAVDRSIIMFHPASIGAMVQGELDKVVSRFTFLKRYVDKMDYYTAARSGQSYASFKALTSQELWIDAEDALASKLIDKVVRVDISPSYQLKLDNASKRKSRAKFNLYFGDV